MCDWLNRCTLFTLSWLLESRGIRQMTKIPVCSWNSHLAPPLLRLRVLLLWSIDSLHFYSRNPSAAYQQLTFPRTLPIPAPHNHRFLAPYFCCDSSIKDNNVPESPRIPQMPPPQIRIGIYRWTLWLHYLIFKQYRKTECVIINYTLLYET